MFWNFLKETLFHLLYVIQAYITLSEENESNQGKIPLKCYNFSLSQITLKGTLLQQKIFHHR